MAYPLTNPQSQFFDSSGSPLSSGTIEFRSPSTDSLIDTFPTADDADAQTNANDNPLTLNSRGEAATGIYLEDAVSYKIVLKDSAGATIWTQDNVKAPLGTDSGSFTGTLTAMSSTTNGTVNWVSTGKLVTLNVASAITGTSNANTMTMTGLPAALQPTRTQTIPSILRDNTANLVGAVSIAADGTVTFLMSAATLTTTGFTTSGNKGLPGGWSVTYSLD